MIDAPQRPKPRFPPAKEGGARDAIRDLLLQIKERHTGTPLMGIAGGACGGDMLFHELCQELDIPSELYLTLIPEEFQETSVSFAGTQWVSRFETLLQTRPYKILPPGYLIQQPNIWEATNEWMMEDALRNGSQHMSLIVLWDGYKGDGKGGTAHMVDVTQGLGAEVRIADMTTL